MNGFRNMTLRIGIVVCALLALCGCEPPSEGEKVSYTLTVVGAISSRPLKFSGTYQFMRDRKRITRDLSGEGNVSVSFLADELVYVRIQGTKHEGIYSLQVTREGKVVYDSPATEAHRPIVYSPDKGGNR